MQVIAIIRKEISNYLGYSNADITDIELNAANVDERDILYFQKYRTLGTKAKQ